MMAALLAMFCWLSLAVKASTCGSSNAVDIAWNWPHMSVPISSADAASTSLAFGCGGEDGATAIKYQATATNAATCTVTTKCSFDTVLHIPPCSLSSPPITQCDDNSGSGTCSSLQVHVGAGETLTVFLRAYNALSIPSNGGTLEIHCNPSAEYPDTNREIAQHEDAAVMSSSSSNDTVTCCFTVDNRVLGVYLNGRSLAVSGVLSDWMSSKYVSFPDPCDGTGNEVTIAIAGKEAVGHATSATSGLIFQCHTSSPDSPFYNFVSSTDRNTWTGVSGTPGFPFGWTNVRCTDYKCHLHVVESTSSFYNTECRSSLGTSTVAQKIYATANDNLYEFGFRAKVVCPRLPGYSARPSAGPTQSPAQNPRITITDAPTTILVFSPGQVPDLQTFRIVSAVIVGIGALILVIFMMKKANADRLSPPLNS